MAEQQMGPEVGLLAQAGDEAAVAAWVDDHQGEVNRMFLFRSISRTLLMAASERGRLKVVKVLVERGANLNLRDINGQTALAMACEHGHSDVVRYLLEHGADASIKDMRSYTPLMSVSAWGRPHIVKILLQLGTQKLEEVDKFGSTALWLACSAGRVEAVKVLLTHSCVDTNARDRYHGLTPKEIAQLQGHREVAELLESFEREMERPYLLYKARAVWNDRVNQERFPTAPVPEYLRDRSLSGRELPAVELLSMPPAAEGGGGGGGRAGDKEDNKPEVAKPSCTTSSPSTVGDEPLPSAPQEEAVVKRRRYEKADEEERMATLAHLMGQLNAELFLELVLGLRRR